MQRGLQTLKARAIHLRQKGHSLKQVELKLGIARSTLSGWFKNVRLSPAQNARLAQRQYQGLVRARKHAAEWHRAQKEKRMREAHESARAALANIPKDSSIVELGLAMLYLGEGNKRDNGPRLGSSDPLIARFYVAALKKLYGIQKNRLSAGLHLRADQDERRARHFWSRTLGIPNRNITYVIHDKRTAGRKTYAHYHGVCYISGGGVAIERKLVYLAQAFARSV